MRANAIDKDEKRLKKKNLNRLGPSWSRLAMCDFPGRPEKTLAQHGKEHGPETPSPSRADGGCLRFPECS